MEAKFQSHDNTKYHGIIWNQFVCMKKINTVQPYYYIINVAKILYICLESHIQLVLYWQ